MNEEANKVVLILLRQKDFVPSIVIYNHHYWKHGNQLTEYFNRVIHSLEELEAIHISKDSKGKDNYALKESVRQRLENRPTKYLDRPYDYLLSFQSKGRLSITKVNKPPTKAQKIITDIAIDLIVTVIGGLILWLLTR